MTRRIMRGGAAGALAACALVLANLTPAVAIGNGGALATDLGSEAGAPAFVAGTPLTPPTATGTASISGTVTVPAGEDVAKVDVVVVDTASGNTPVAQGFADAAGHYDLGGLPAGIYKLLFDAFGTAQVETEWWDGAAGAQEVDGAIPISLAEGASATADATLVAAGGSMQGTLGPVSFIDATPQLRACAVRQGSWSIVERCTQVSSTGAYALASLRPGDYKLGFILGADKTMTTASGPIAARGRTFWWTQRADYATGDIVTVPAGAVTGLDEDVTGIKADLNTLNPCPGLSGSVVIGQPLTAHPGLWSPDVTPSYEWYADGVPIPGAAGASFTPTPTQAGKTISVDVYAPSDFWPGVDEYMTARMGRAEVLPQLAGSQPSITGTLSEGFRLTAHPGVWPSGSSLRYHWFADGIYIVGSTSSSPTFTLTRAQVFKKITVKVTATKPGYATTFWFSLPTLRVMYTSRPVIGSSFSTSPAWVGATLKAFPWAWSATSFSYHWYASGVAIPGATGKSFKVTRAQLGKTIKVLVTGRASGYGTVSRWSAPTSPATWSP